jgi:hypothetical protein
MTAGKGGLRNIVQRLIENLSQPGEDAESKLLLLRQLRSTNNWTALRAIERLRALGALEDGTLINASLMGASLANADLHRVNFGQANMTEADLTGANLMESRLSGADLLGANLNRANLFRADLSSVNLFRAKLVGANLQETFLFQADLRGADLKTANLSGARLSTAHLDGATVTLGQLVQVGMLSGSTMPDGSPYDGRFNLTGDIQFALFLDLEMDVNDSAAMARFYEVPLSDYMRGQSWAQEYLPRLKEATAQATVEGLVTGQP